LPANIGGASVNAEVVREDPVPVEAAPHPAKKANDRERSHVIRKASPRSEPIQANSALPAVEGQQAHGHQRGRLRTPEAAAHLRVSKSLLEKLRVSGRGPEYQKLGKIVTYTLEALDSWANARKRNSTSEPTIE